MVFFVCMGTARAWWKGDCVCPGGMPIEFLEVDSPPEGPVLLGADDHSVAPSVRGPQGDLLEDSQADVPVLTSSCQWMDIGIGVWPSFGVAVGSMFRVRGGRDIIGRVWCSHTLKQLAA